MCGHQDVVADANVSCSVQRDRVLAGGNLVVGDDDVLARLIVVAGVSPHIDASRIAVCSGNDVASDGQAFGVTNVAVLS